MIHVVMGEIIAAGAGRADSTHGPRQEAARRIAHHERQPSAATIAANDAETLDVVKAGIVGAVLAQSEADAGQKNLVDESLEDRRKSHVPDRERKHERLCRKETIHV